MVQMFAKGENQLYFTCIFDICICYMSKAQGEYTLEN